MPLTRNVICALYVLLAASLLHTPARGQEKAVFAVQPESKMWIDGTSNKSDWTVEVEQVSGYVKMNAAVPVPSPGIDEVHLVVPAGEMRSNKSTIMDRLMQKALKSEQHPEILYDLTRLAPVPASDGATDALALQTHGRLTIAGETNEIDVLVHGKKLADGTVRFTGSHNLKMTDYGMKPPTAMFGALHTGDEVVVRFDLVVAPEAGK